jgi:hypothetical protein
VDGRHKALFAPMGKRFFGGAGWARRLISPSGEMAVQKIFRVFPDGAQSRKSFKLYEIGLTGIRT